MSKVLFPALTFVLVFIFHIVFFKFNNSGCQADGGAGWFAAYLGAREYYLGFSYAFSLAFAAFAFMKFKEYRKKALGAGIGIGVWAVILWTAGCFLAGCCGSPMWLVYLNLFGVPALKIPKWSMAAISLVMVLLSCLWLKRRTAGISPEIRSPTRLAIGWSDYARMFYSWIFLFGKRPYALMPGLYFTGDKYDKNTPLIVTCNFLSTVVLLRRNIRPLNVRLLIVDTGGINVWCSAGKGKFSSQEILNKLNMYERSTITDSEEIELIIPKLSLSGVKLSELKRNNVRPVIGPVYANKLRQYLEHPPYKDRALDTVNFGIKARAYTVVPTAAQFSKNVILAAVLLFILDKLFKTGFPWQVIPTGFAISFFYPLLFPWLAGRRFAVKGISLALLFSLFLIFLYTKGSISLYLATFYTAFIFGTSIFLALSYTGNTPVSNYSKVKKEIVTFLPLSVFCYVIAVFFYFLSGSYR